VLPRHRCVNLGQRERDAVNQPPTPRKIAAVGRYSKMPRPHLLLALAATSAFAPVPHTTKTTTTRQVRWPWQKKQQAEEGEGGDDITNSPVFLQKKVGVLQNELVQLDKDIAAAEAKKAENWDEWGSQIENMRNEFAAVKKRTQEARTRAEAVERAGVLDQLLGPIDNFDRAIVAQKTRADASEGVQKVVDRYTGPALRGNQPVRRVHGRPGSVER
jgi:molecular chaperone GrpE (heat shock protein)